MTGRGGLDCALIYYIMNLFKLALFPVIFGVGISPMARPQSSNDRPKMPIGSVKLALMSFLLISALLLLPQGSAQPPNDPFSVIIAAQWPREKVGSDLPVNVTITNTSTKRITIIDTRRFCDYDVDIRDGAGDVPPTGKWRQKIKCEGVEISGRRIIRELKPNESYSDLLILKQWYEVDHPGKYQVQIERKIPDQLGKGWVKSNMITLTVTE